MEALNSNKRCKMLFKFVFKVPFWVLEALINGLTWCQTRFCSFTPSPDVQQPVALGSTSVCATVYKKKKKICNLIEKKK